MLVAVTGLALFGALTLELFFYASFFGFLLIMGTTAPVYRTARWRRGLRWFVAVGVVVFAYLIVTRLLSVIPAGGI
jgi:hypothetical protein